MRLGPSLAVILRLWPAAILLAGGGGSSPPVRQSAAAAGGSGCTWAACRAAYASEALAGGGGPGGSGRLGGGGGRGPRARARGGAVPPFLALRGGQGAELDALNVSSVAAVVAEAVSVRVEGSEKGHSTAPSHAHTHSSQLHSSKRSMWFEEGSFVPEEGDTTHKMVSPRRGDSSRAVHSNARAAEIGGGGGVDDGDEAMRDAQRDLIVPDEYELVEDAVGALSGPSQQVFVRAGNHIWEGLVAMDKRDMHIAGDEQARMIGSWIMLPGSDGDFQGVSLAKRADPDEPIQHACVNAFTSTWVFEECELRGIACTVLRLVEKANVTLNTCNLGGVDKTIDQLASNALTAMSFSTASLFRCNIEDTGELASRPLRTLRGKIVKTSDELSTTASGGVRAFNNAKIRLRGCRMQNNDVSLAVMESAQVSAVMCKITGGELAILSASNVDFDSMIELQECTLRGKVWLDYMRPGTLKEDGKTFLYNPDKLTAAYLESKAPNKAPPLPDFAKPPPVKRGEAAFTEEEQVAQIFQEKGMGKPVFNEDGILVNPEGEKEDSDSDNDDATLPAGIRIPHKAHQRSKSANAPASQGPQLSPRAGAKSEPVTPARGRGRPSPLTPKRSPGRPSLSPTRSPPVTPQGQKRPFDAAGQPITPTSKRGRPPQTSSPPPAPSRPVTPTAKRGRPPKESSPPRAPSQPVTPTSTRGPPPKESSPPQAPSQPVTPTSTRGRPSNMSSPPPARAQLDTPVSPRRGRPSKSSVDSVPATPTTPRKPAGRPPASGAPRAQPTTTDSPEQAASRNSQSPSQSSHVTPTSIQRRGRASSALTSPKTPTSSRMRAGDRDALRVGIDEEAEGPVRPVEGTV